MKLRVPAKTDLAYLGGELVGVAGVLSTPALGPQIDTTFHTHIGEFVVGVASIVTLIGSKFIRVQTNPAGLPARSTAATAAVVLPTSTKETPLMASPTFIGQVADAVIAAAEANRATIIPALSAAEGGLAGLITNGLNSIKPSGAILPLVWDAVKPSIVAELVALETANPGSVIFGILDAEAHALATQIGG